MELAISDDELNQYPELTEAKITRILKEELSIKATINVEDIITKGENV